MKFHVPGLVVGVVAAALGAAAWAAVAYFVQIEISWLALVIGAMVGYGVGRYSPGVPGFVRGAVAVVLAVGSIVGGKYLSARLYLDKEIETVTALMQSPTVLSTAFSIEKAWLAYLDRQTVEAIEMGRELDWPKGMTYEEADEEHEYPTEIVAEAAKKWKALSPAERETFRAQWEQWMRENLTSDLALARSKEMMKELFRDMFDRIDIIFGAMAVVAAFSIAKRDDLL